MRSNTTAEQVAIFVLAVFIIVVLMFPGTGASIRGADTKTGPEESDDTGHTEGCCCCGGNELHNAIDINVNILAYVMTF